MARCVGKGAADRPHALAASARAPGSARSAAEGAEQKMSLGQKARGSFGNGDRSASGQLHGHVGPGMQETSGPQNHFWGRERIYVTLKALTVDKITDLIQKKRECGTQS